MLGVGFLASTYVAGSRARYKSVYVSKDHSHHSVRLSFRILRASPSTECSSENAFSLRWVNKEQRSPAHTRVVRPVGADVYTVERRKTATSQTRGAAKDGTSVGANSRGGAHPDRCSGIGARRAVAARHLEHRYRGSWPWGSSTCWSATWASWCPPCSDSCPTGTQSSTISCTWLWASSALRWPTCSPARGAPRGRRGPETSENSIHTRSSGNSSSRRLGE